MQMTPEFLELAGKVALKCASDAEILQYKELRGMLLKEQKQQSGPKVWIQKRLKAIEKLQKEVEYIQEYGTLPEVKTRKPRVKKADVLEESLA